MPSPVAPDGAARGHGPSSTYQATCATPRKARLRSRSGRRWRSGALCTVWLALLPLLDARPATAAAADGGREASKQASRTDGDRGALATIRDRLRGGSGSILESMAAEERKREDVGKGDHFKRLGNEHATLETVARVDHHHHHYPPKAERPNAGKDDPPASEEADEDEDEDEDVQRLVDADDNEFVISRPQGLGTMEMHEDINLIEDLVQLFVAASVGGLVVGAGLKQPPIVGYLLAGAVIGPGGLNIVDEIVQCDSLAQFGVVFMLYNLGAHFNPSKLEAVKYVSVLGGGGAVLLFIVVGGVLGAAAEGAAGVPTGMFVGGFLAMSSTAVVWKCLTESQDVYAVHGQVTIGILLLQDVVLCVLLATLPTLAALRHSMVHAQDLNGIGASASPGRHMLGASMIDGTAPHRHPFRRKHAPMEAHPTGFMFLTYKVVSEATVFLLFALGAYACAKSVVPRVLGSILRRANTQKKSAGNATELYQLGTVSMCLLMALASEKLRLGLEVGAFTSGLMLSGTEHSENALHLIEPLKNLFSALFFACVGMLMHPSFIIRNLPALLCSLVCLLAVKAATISIVCRTFNYPWRTSLLVGITVSQVGEFGFVLLSRAEYFGLVSFQLYLLLLGTSALSLLTTPLVYSLGRRLV